MAQNPKKTLKKCSLGIPQTLRTSRGILAHFLLCRKGRVSSRISHSTKQKLALRFVPDPFLAMAMAMAMAMAILLISASSSSSSYDTSQGFPYDRSSSPNASPERNELLELQHVILSLGNSIQKLFFPPRKNSTGRSLQSDGLL
jgi:type VI protein secretion system component VasF